MNFGERLKQLRTQKNLTQPQLAVAVGIEQSYLSKLENDKSVPGAETFQAILRALNMDVASFLDGVDDAVVQRELRQVPEVANHLNALGALRIHSVKTWLFTSAILGVLGLTLFTGGYRQLFSTGMLYTYESLGVVHADEPSELFDIFDRWLIARRNAGEFDEVEMNRRRVEYIARMQSELVTTTENRGSGFIDQVPGGTRFYKFKSSSFGASALNRYLMLAGVLLAFSSLFGFFVEWRLRSLKRSP